MLGLKLETDPRWVNIVEKNISEILTDHAYCEQKAASNAISVIVKYAEYPDLVKAMVEIAQEEMEHFGMVHDKILERGFELGFERKDPYVNDLAAYLKKVNSGGSREKQFVNRMMFAAMIEARSCERFRLLWKNISDKELSMFYYELMVSEAGHYKNFIQLAKEYKPADYVQVRWKQLLNQEAVIIKNIKVRPDRMH